MTTRRSIMSRKPPASASGWPNSRPASTLREASHEAGMSVLMGAPNVVRGGSHSGNIAATDLARQGVLDVLSSDYVPFSLIHAPFVLADEIDGLDLPRRSGW
jgi:alpha-D-ribose 1-methylphosphonate 5-triphosphate diphosphatase PhnM